MTDNTDLKRLAQRVIDIEALDGGEPIGEAWGEFEAAATPAAVLALIAENERLHESDQEATELCDTLSVLLGEIAVAVRGPEEPKSRHGFHDLPSRVKTVVSERDQLKADNERLRKGSVRYEWLRDKQTFIWLIQDWFPSDAEFTDVDAVIDAAMGKGELS